MQPILLDTCAAIWMSTDQPVKAQAAALVNSAYSEGSPVFVSPITAWEIGLFVSRNRLSLQFSPQVWFSQLLASSRVTLAELPPDVFIASSFLPGKPPRDPADRIIAATARELGATLITRDSALLGYAKQGHLNAIAC